MYLLLLVGSFEIEYSGKGIFTTRAQIVLRQGSKLVIP